MSRTYNNAWQVINTQYFLAIIIIHQKQTALGWKPPFFTCSQMSVGTLFNLSVFQFSTL